MRIKFQFLI